MVKNTDLIDISSAAKLLGVSKITLRNWDNSGILKAIRIGNRGDRRYKKQDLDKFLNKKQEIEEINKDQFMNYIKTEKFWTDEAPGLPLTLEIGILKMSDTEKYFKPCLSHSIFYTEKDYMKQILSIQESLESCKAQIKAVKEDPEKIEIFLKEYEEIYEKTEKFLKRLEFIKIDSLSNEALVEEFNKFNKVLGKFWEVGLVVEPYNHYLDDYYMPKITKLIGDEKKAKESFATLTLPFELSFVARERRDFLRLILKYFQSPRQRNLIKNLPYADYLAELKMNYPEIFRAIQEHQQNYYWVQNSYGQWTILSIIEFTEFIKGALKEFTLTDLKKELNELEDTEAIKEKRNNIIKQFKIPSEIDQELQHIQNVTWIKDERKKIVLMMLHHMFRFFEEFGKRTGLEPKLTSYAKISELPDLLEKNLDINILNERREGIFIVSQNKNKISFFTGNDVIPIKNILLKENSHSETENFQGIIACRGENPIILGKAKVILNPYKETISEDEILITPMTRPDFVQLMRKARAVITDIGGITSHAAIVSREMNKPCIIGTKIATKVLKNGDELELRMNHGTVRKIKGKNK
ncbi:MAG: PEP-utilizing enzyme [archaeon]